MKSSNGKHGCESNIAVGLDQATICSDHCGARCCKYISIKIKPPNSESDWDEFWWWLSHDGISVVKDEDGWMVIVTTRCDHLQANNLCGIHPHHPKTCLDYDPTNCEYTGPVEFEVCLTSPDDLVTYMQRRRLKRGAKVAAKIRRSRRASRSKSSHASRFGGGLLPLIAASDGPGPDVRFG